MGAPDQEGPLFAFQYRTLRRPEHSRGKLCEAARDWAVLYEQAHITGILLVAGQMIFHYLEGPAELLYGRAITLMIDDDQSQLSVVRSGPVEERLASGCLGRVVEVDRLLEEEISPTLIDSMHRHDSVLRRCLVHVSTETAASQPRRAEIIAFPIQRQEG